ncbi:MAG: hypothetical protein H7Y16_06245 [Candidatus Parcubacteria bacterium]|nr:hypothetical protein [Burkholderiales bacterium]
MIVVGMHRSGTSALARVVSLLGFNLPKTLLPPSTANSTGYWESLPLNQLDDELLAFAGSHWAAWRQLRPGWAGQALVGAFKTKALSILESEFGAAKALVVKDPRMSRLIGFWRDVIESFGATPLMVFVIRSPLEVAASLAKREAFAPALSHVMWLRNVLDAEFATRGTRRTFTSYEELLNDWRPVVDKISADLGISWPRSPEQAATEISSFLSQEHRHNVAPMNGKTGSRALPDRLRTTFAIFSRWALEREDPADFSTLDGIRQGLDEIPSALLPLIDAGHEHMIKARKQRDAIKQHAAELVRLESEPTVASEHVHELRAQLARHKAEAAAQAKKLEDLRVLLIHTTGVLEERESEIRSKNAQLKTAATSTEMLERQFARRDAEASASAQHLDEVRAKLIQTAGTLVERETAAKARNSQFKAAAKSGELLKQKLLNVRKELAATNAALDSVRAQARQLNLELRQIRSSAVWKLIQTLRAPARVVEHIRKLAVSRFNSRESDDVALAAASGLFDRSWYLARYPDVATERIDPVLHYMRHGAAEGRDPGPRFSTRWYLERHADVAEAGVNPLLHYLSHGMAEGRAVKPSSPASGVVDVPKAPLAVGAPPAVAAEPLSFALPPAFEEPWVTQAAMQGDPGNLSLELSGLILGTLPVLRGDTDDAWFAVADPARALAAFCALSGVVPGKALRLVGDSSVEIASKLATLLNPAVCPILSFERGATHTRPADVWYVTDSDLRVRFDRGLKGDAPAYVVRFFQCDLPSGGSLRLVGESVLAGIGADFADVALRNAFLPVLMTLSTTDSQLISASLLPFPSLCRGGAHYPELLGRSADYLENLRSASGFLLGEMLDESRTARDFSVARIEVDLEGAMGTERIYSLDVLEWLAATMHIRLAPAPSSADRVENSKVRSYLEQALAVASTELHGASGKIAKREGAGAFVLTIPADAIPALHALVSRKICIAPEQACCVGSYFVTGNTTGKAEWAVSMPAMGDELIERQPAGAAICFPFLRRVLTVAEDAGAQHAHRIPLAVRFSATRVPVTASTIMPVAPDVAGPLLRIAGPDEEDATASITVVLATPDLEADRFDAVLDSLRLQTIAARIEVVVVCETGRKERRRATEFALQCRFPGRFRLLEGSAGASRNAGINQAVAHATGGFLLIAGAGVVLHDPRTLETLCAIANHGKVASAGCVLLQAGLYKGTRIASFRSGGIFPSPGAGSSDPRMTFSETHCLSVFPFATYPVAANSSALFMVRADVWAKIGGFDAAAFPDAHGDIDYGMRAISEGYVQFCTSTISAEICDSSFAAPYTDEVIPISPLAPGWDSVAEFASSLRALKS